MPLFYQHTINDFTKLAIWKIEEPEDFFLRRVPVNRAVTHPHKRLQHLAGRYLLPVLFPDFPLSEILIADTRKPYLEKEAFHFSLSHCEDYAAAIVSSRQRVGIDIELVSPKIRKVQNKFLTERDYMLANENIAGLRKMFPDLDAQLLTILWSVKEAVFKWYGSGKVDFRKHIRISGATADSGDWLILPVSFEKEQPVNLSLQARSFGPLVLSWVMS